MLPFVPRKTGRGIHFQAVLENNAYDIFLMPVSKRHALTQAAKANKLVGMLQRTLRLMEGNCTFLEITLDPF